MDQSVFEKKNKNNIDKLNSIIHEYQFKLDARVNQVISEMIGYTKKIQDSPLPPILWDKKLDNHKNIDKSINYRHKNKSHSQHSEISFINDSSLNMEVSQLRNTFKEVGSSKLINQPGRTVGNHIVAKPKFQKKKPEIVPKEIRLNPLHQRNAIKAYELDKGILSLIEKGKIGRDVNIITAFEKGRPILNTQKAIFHQGQQRFAELEGQRQESSVSKNPKEQPVQRMIDSIQKRYQESWALTMPKQQYSLHKDYNSSIQTRDMKSQSLNFNFKEQIFIKLQHYQIQHDSHYKLVTNKNLTYKAQIIQILHQICKVMKIYSIDIGYADSSKVLEHVSKPYRIRKQDLLNCIVGYKNGNFKSLQSVRGQYEKQRLALDKIVGCFRFNLQRKYFLKYLTKKKVANRIYGWAVSCRIVRKSRELIKQQRKQINEDYNILQQQFQHNYPSILQKKHYEIHLINEQFPLKQDYKDILNIQLTRIFDIKNINKFIIYLLPYHLDEETINYYYKIMELEEIPNYKQRVCFIEVDSKRNFGSKLNLSQKLYYNSETIRKINRKIKDNPAYFVVGYPAEINIKISTYFKIPILSGNLHQTFKLDKRSLLQDLEEQTLERLIVDSSKQHSLMALADELSQFCMQNKRVRKYIVKIDNYNRSRGIALLSAPFSSLPEMYSNTALVTAGIDVDTFYHSLLKQGGIVQKYQESVSFVTVVVDLDIKGNVGIVGTFQKVSSGFVNIGYIFPQKKIDNKMLLKRSREVCSHLVRKEHIGTAELTFIVNDIQDIYLEKIQCYSTHLCSALHYYKFLSDGELVDGGDYMAKIVDTFEGEGRDEEIVTFQPRSFCYIPFLLHFGLSDRQVGSFFQLCRMGGVSFDLQNKYGATFILLGSMKSSMGLITTAKDKKASVKLMLKSLQFILKQNSHNMSNATLIEKQARMKQRQNILNVKERLQNV